MTAIHNQGTRNLHNDVPPIFVHFFNWFWEHDWQKDTVVDPFDWSFMETQLNARGSQPFYADLFNYIKGLGITAIAWHFSAGHEPAELELPNLEVKDEPTDEICQDCGKPMVIKIGRFGRFFSCTGECKATRVFSFPHSNVIDALNDSGLKIAPFYDFEMSVQAHRKLLPRPELVNSGLIKADAETVDIICSDLAHYYENVPSQLFARDGDGNAVIFIFGYGFNDEDPDPARWSWFATELGARVSQWVGVNVKFYWSCTNTHFQEHLFLHHRDRFTPFNFVVDTPQSQFSHDSVTWNFGFDNLYVKRYYNLKRVVRMDPRYVEEPAWLAHATDPALIFIYGFDEPYESSLLFPTRAWGDAKARLAKYYIQRLRTDQGGRLPPVLTIVDDLDQQWADRMGDWHLTVLREMLLYRLRLFAPQSDVTLPAEVTAEMLAGYDYVIDLTSEKTHQLLDLLKTEWDRLRLLVFDPLAPLRNIGHANRFFETISYKVVNQDTRIEGTGRLLAVRDDTHPGVVRKGCAVKLWTVPEQSDKIPLVIVNRNATFVNSYANNEEVMRCAFEEFYGRPMGTSILYGEGHASRRLEQNIDGSTVRNRLLRYSVNLRWPIPSAIDWYKLPPEIEESDFNFVFGLED